MKVENKIYYHICKYQEFDLSPFQDYNTENIHRTIELCNPEKKLLETQLEEYRRQNFPDTPSRQNCFYVCKESQVELWLKKLIKRRNIWYKIYQVSVTGEMFLANENDIEIAEAYWKGCDENDEQCTIEGLFIGYLNVISDCTNKFARP